jgi:hypothetical protein
MPFHLIARKALALAAVPMLAAPNLWDAQPRMSGEISMDAFAGRPASVASILPPVVKSDKPKRERPSWIWNLFGFGETPGECTSFMRAGEVAPPRTVRRYEEISLCFKGFKSTDAPRLQVFGPDGERTQRPMKATMRVGGGLQWFWYDDDAGAVFKRPGVFRFTVTAAHTAGTSGSIVVKPATKTAVYFSSDDTIRPGETVTGTAVGRRPGSEVLASLYGDEFGPELASKLRLLKDLEPVPADLNGEAVIRWEATKNLTSGTYVMLVEPFAPGKNECDLQCTVFEVKS